MKDNDTTTDNLPEVIRAFRDLLPKCQFVGVTYTSKRSGETARYTLRVNSSYKEHVEKKIVECDIQLKDESLSRDERFAWAELKHSFETTLDAMSRGEENPNYTKKGMYWKLGNGIKMLTNDQTLEVQGIVHSYKVIEPGFHPKVNHRNEVTRLKKEIQSKILDKWVTLALDVGHVHSVRLNGETIEID